MGSASPDGVSGGPSFRYINENGDTAIPGPFASALPFSGGVAVASAVTGDGTVRYGAIDRAGAWLIEPKFNSLFEFSDGLAAAQIDNPDLSARIGLHRRHRRICRDPGQGAAPCTAAAFVRTEPPYYLVDRGGNTVLTPDYDQSNLPRGPGRDGRGSVGFNTGATRPPRNIRGFRPPSTTAWSR